MLLICPSQGRSRILVRHREFRFADCAGEHVSPCTAVDQELVGTGRLSLVRMYGECAGFALALVSLLDISQCTLKHEEK